MIPLENNTMKPILGDKDNPAEADFTRFKKNSDQSAVMQKRPFYYRFIKRLFDIVFSACAIVVFLIPGIILSIAIAIDTKGSPIYSSVRVGHKGSFKFYKFRSMVADSDDLEKYLSPEQLSQWHKEHKVDNDPRITKLGAFLRSTSIDELVQFIHVLLGQMSIVGPRPITEEELQYLGSERELYLSVPSGITGFWQTGPRNLATWESGLRQEFELTYVKNASLKFDARIFINTIKVILVRTGR